MAVSLQNTHPAQITTTTLLQAALRLLQEEGFPDCEVSVVLTDDDTVHELNLRYRGFDKPTDVLSFAQLDQIEGAPSLPNVGELPLLLGDVIISVDTAARQAQAHHISLEKELELLIVHGILHLLGYEDDTEEGAELMREREFAILNR